MAERDRILMRKGSPEAFQPSFIEGIDGAAPPESGDGGSSPTDYPSVGPLRPCISSSSPSPSPCHAPLPSHSCAASPCVPLTDSFRDMILACCRAVPIGPDDVTWRPSTGAAMVPFGVTAQGGEGPRCAGGLAWSDAAAAPYAASQIGVITALMLAWAAALPAAPVGGEGEFSCPSVPAARAGQLGARLVIAAFANRRDAHGYTILHELCSGGGGGSAAACCVSRCIAALLQMGANPCIAAGDGTLPIHHAAMLTGSGKRRDVGVGADQRADGDADDVAVRIVEALLCCGSRASCLEQLTARDGTMGWTVFHYAAASASWHSDSRAEPSSTPTTANGLLAVLLSAFTVCTAGGLVGSVAGAPLAALGGGGVHAMMQVRDRYGATPNGILFAAASRQAAVTAGAGTNRGSLHALHTHQ